MSLYVIFNDQSFNDTLTNDNDIVSFEQVRPGKNGLFTPVVVSADHSKAAPVLQFVCACQLL